MFDKQSLDRLLFRVAVELSYRSDQLHTYLDAIDEEWGEEYRQLTSTMRSALKEIHKPLPAYIEEVADASGAEGERARKALYGHLKRYCRWFVKVHALLTYLPRPSVREEARTVLEASFGAWYSEVDPSLILGTIFNALEFDFVDIVKNRLPDFTKLVDESSPKVVLQLAVCDRDCPTAWAILAHELGHALNDREQISKNVADDLVRDPNSQAYAVVANWAKEFCADLVAAKALGSVPIQGLVSLEYCALPHRKIWEHSETHPITRWRLAVVDEFLGASQRGESFKEELRWYKTVFRDRLQIGAGDAAKEVEELLAKQFEYIVEPIYNRLEPKVRAIELDVPEMKPSKLARCRKRLRKGRPASAQGRPREELRDELEKYRDGEGMRGEENGRAEKFYQLAHQFEESPLPVSMILSAGTDVRVRMIDEGIRAAGTRLAESEGIAELISEINKVDDTTVSSVDMSRVHGMLNEARGPG